DRAFEPLCVTPAVTLEVRHGASALDEHRFGLETRRRQGREFLIRANGDVHGVTRPAVDGRLVLYADEHLGARVTAGALVLLDVDVDHERRRAQRLARKADVEVVAKGFAAGRSFVPERARTRRDQTAGARRFLRWRRAGFRTPLRSAGRSCGPPRRV